MKTTLCFTLTTLIFVTLAFVPNSSAQDTSPEFTVRLIYFIPNDREPFPNIDDDYDAVIKEARQYFADMMEFYEFERKTFRLETDENEKAIVHQVKGERDTKYHQQNLRSHPETRDIKKKFDIEGKVTKNIYLILVDIEEQGITGPRTYNASGSGDSTDGIAWTTTLGLSTIVHELGHTFGLRHDYRRDEPFFATDRISVRMCGTYCDAEWLDRHRYFNPGETPFNKNTNVQMLPPSLAAPPDFVRFQFEITDPDGLHQIKFVNTNPGTIISCEKLNGKSDTAELVTTELINSPSVRIQVMDIYGNYLQDNISFDLTPILPSETVSIPDPNLADAIRDTLRLTSAANITRHHMLRLRRFTATRRQITELTGLEHAIRIYRLDLSNNQIRDITSLTELTNLWHLTIANNLIRDITPLKRLKNLQFLYLWDNKISDMYPITTLTNLQRLNLNKNQINDIHTLTTLANLESLSLSQNQISDIQPLTGLTNLVTLILAHNQISDITPLTALTNLQDLILAGNHISNIQPLAGLTNLQDLMIAENEISDINSLTGLAELVQLNLWGNQISNIRPLSGLTHLNGLHLSENQISNIRPLSGLTHLNTLHLSENQISNIKPLEGLTNLRILSLQENLISEVNSLTALVNLAELRLWKNSIKDKKPLLTLLRKNPDVKIYLKYGGEPLPVTLSHFRAEHTEKGIILNWTTESEIDNAGFYIYRSQTKEGEFKVVNPTMVQGAGTTGKRNNYTWTDTTAKPNTVYYYRIEDVSHAGVREQLATVRLRGFVSASGKFTTRWADLKSQ